ncbi:MAG: type I DNA topoisomerase [Bacteroidales bacterium]|jgi:DNA topoisomerase-1|nr:type I DNA topoisomerase [Bacteroidales bacterium]
MAKNLVIVESPAKAKTIERFLGNDYVVKSSFGHIRDLAKKGLGINLANNSYTPDYEISADKKKLVSELKKDVKNAETVWLASDEDREGEAIAWHLFETLNLKNTNTKRIVFHEITKDAIVHAIQNPRSIDYQLVDAQQARRVLDRLVGFELSPVLWKKVKPALSAGRVQSVTVRIVVDREREIIGFESTSAFKVTAIFNVTQSEKTYSFSAELNKKFDTADEATAFLQSSIGVNFVVSACEQKPAAKSPAPPFTTSTLQQEASRKLGFPVAKTMQVAQRLYESGHITYMRTDSTNLSGLAINTIKNHIITTFGEQYSKVRQFATKSKGAQEAHEAIRPTYVDNEHVSASADEQRLYDLIRKRTIASQMADARFERTTIIIDCPQAKNTNFAAKGEVILFDGFLKVYMESSDDEKEDENVILPPLKVAAPLSLHTMQAVERFTQHPPRYTEATLVRKLEELGIGRPSTYAPTISTIQKRGYIVKEDRPGKERRYKTVTLANSRIQTAEKTEMFGAEKAKLFPTDMGIVVNDFLLKHFPAILDFNFTAHVEKEFDDIAEGKLQWQTMIDQFYKPFHASVDTTMETSERGNGGRELGIDPESGKPVLVRMGRFGAMVQLGEATETEKPTFVSLPKGQLIETITLQEALNLLYQHDDKPLGTDPKTGKNVYIKIGRFGPFVQLGETSDADKRYVGLMKGQSPETITLPEALKLVTLPRELGEFEGKKVEVNTGRFGPFISHNKTFTSIGKNQPDIFTITLEQAVELIKQKREKDEKRHIKSFPEDAKISVMLDRWGKPSVYYNKKYFRITSKQKPEDVTLQDCYAIAGVKKK